MSIYSRVVVRLLVFFVLVFSVVALIKPVDANAVTCHDDCFNALRSCDLACLFDPACETFCDDDYQACIACCDTGC